MTSNAEIKSLLLSAPDSQLDALCKPLIEKWSEPPTALQVLEVLDKVIAGALGSSFMVVVLQSLYDTACKNENTTHDKVVALATWRKE